MKIYRPARDSHKGQNGRLLVIGGSELFHASIFWAADVASRIVDLVHFSSPAMENNELVRKKAKEGFWNGIVVPWEKVEEYIREDDCVVIGPGMTRIKEDGTADITNGLLKKYPDKRWVIDGGALQEMDVDLIPKNAILTPHKREFEGLLKRSDLVDKQQGQTLLARKYNCVVVLKGQEDLVCAAEKCETVSGGNEGMTKGGTGDVLAGLVGALYCKNDAWFAATTGSYVNKKAGDNLYKRVGVFFNAGDLVNEVPTVLASLY